MIYNDLSMLFFYAMILFLLTSTSRTQTLTSDEPIAALDVIIARGRSCLIFCSLYCSPCSGHHPLFFGARCCMEGGAVIR